MLHSDEDMIVSRNYGIFLEKPADLKESPSLANLGSLTNNASSMMLSSLPTNRGTNLNAVGLKTQQLPTVAKAKPSISSDKLIINAKLYILEILEVFVKTQFQSKLFFLKIPSN